MNRRYALFGFSLLGAVALLALLIVVTAAPAASQPAATPAAWLDAPAQAWVGVPLSLTWTISDVANLGAFEARLTYDPSMMAYQNLTHSGFLASTGRNTGGISGTTTLLQTGTGYVLAGDYSWGDLAGPNAAEATVLATYTFTPTTYTCAGAPTTLVLSDVILADTDANQIAPITVSGDATQLCYRYDLDCDVDLDIFDLQTAANVFTNGDYWRPVDFDDDHDVDIFDVQTMANVYSGGWSSACP